VKKSASGLTPQQEQLLLDIVSRLEPKSLAKVARGIAGGFDPADTPGLKLIVGRELVARGVTDGKINEYGIELDALIGGIGPIP